MRATFLRTLAPPLLALLATVTFLAPAVAQSDDPDLPGHLGGSVDRETYLRLRDAHVGLIRGVPYDTPYNPRLEAIASMRTQLEALAPFTSSSAWTPIGPAPIPNGQTTSRVDPVSGRVTAIAVHPTNPDIVYVGTAQGGVYRSLDGGATWIPIFDQAATLAIGALALAPSDPTILYVGTGEPNLSLDSFFGVGIYRIDDADTAPVLNGPINPEVATGIPGTTCFTGRSVSRILVHPSDPATIFVSTVNGYSGLSGDPAGGGVPPLALRGIYRSTDATSASPSFQKLTVTATGSVAPDVTGNRAITDMVFEPDDPNSILCWVYGYGVAGDGGLYRTSNALAANPSFNQTWIYPVATGFSRAALTIMRSGGVNQAYLALERNGNGGELRSSADGGATWSAPLAGGTGFCGGQCWYDLVVTVHPTNPGTVLIGGSGNYGGGQSDYAISTNGGASFDYGRDTGLHCDCHAIVFASSNPAVVYHGNDGGVWKSTDGGLTWTSLNVSPFSATQFQSVAVHPTDARFSIGGTQDNGTNWYRPSAAWTRADWGDGGFVAIDQNAADTTHVTMYHTYYNLTNSLLGFVRVDHIADARDGYWPFLGCNGTTSNNGLGCGDDVLFYAPLVLGPGSPNTVYFGTDRLYRSIDKGATLSVVSQAPIELGAKLGAIAISPQNDNVRLVGLTNGKIYGTVSGSSTLVDYSTVGMPTKYVGRLAIDPSNANVAYAAFDGYGVAAGKHVWKTLNLTSGAPVWAASGSGIPDVPVNAFVVDPADPSQLFAGTDIGVYVSNDAGANWLPFNTGLPVVAVFDMAIQSPSGILRVATHGRGMWERFIRASAGVALMVVGSEFEDGRVRLTWRVADYAGTVATVQRRPEPGDWSVRGQVRSSGAGQFAFEDADVVPGRTYVYRLSVLADGRERMGGEVWIDVPARGAELVLRAVSPNPSRDGFRVSFRLSDASPAAVELLDVTGRRVEARNVGPLGAGAHQVELGRDRSLEPGAYWVRLSQAGRSFTRRVAVLR
jgi:hypothetical protein